MSARFHYFAGIAYTGPGKASRLAIFLFVAFPPRQPADSKSVGGGQQCVDRLCQLREPLVLG